MPWSWVSQQITRSASCSRWVSTMIVRRTRHCFRAAAIRRRRKTSVWASSSRWRDSGEGLWKKWDSETEIAFYWNLCENKSYCSNKTVTTVTCDKIKRDKPQSLPLFRLAPSQNCIISEGFLSSYKQLVTPKAVPRAVSTVMRNWMMFFQTFLLIVIGK